MKTPAILLFGAASAQYYQGDYGYTQGSYSVETEATYHGYRDDWATSYQYQSLYSDPPNYSSSTSDQQYMSPTPPVYSASSRTRISSYSSPAYSTQSSAQETNTVGLGNTSSAGASSSGGSVPSQTSTAESSSLLVVTSSDLISTPATTIADSSAQPTYQSSTEIGSGSLSSRLSSTLASSDTQAGKETSTQASTQASTQPSTQPTTTFRTHSLVYVTLTSTTVVYRTAAPAEAQSGTSSFLEHHSAEASSESNNVAAARFVPFLAAVFALLA